MTNVEHYILQFVFIYGDDDLLDGGGNVSVQNPKFVIIIVSIKNFSFVYGKMFKKNNSSSKDFIASIFSRLNSYLYSVNVIITLIFMAPLAHFTLFNILFVFCPNNEPPSDVKK